MQTKTRAVTRQIKAAGKTNNLLQYNRNRTNIKPVTRLTRRMTIHHVEQAIDLVQTNSDLFKSQLVEKKTSTAASQEATERKTRSKRDIKIPEQHKAFYQILNTKNTTKKRGLQNKNNETPVMIDLSSDSEDETFNLKFSSLRRSKKNNRDKTMNSKSITEIGTKNETINISNVTIRRHNKLTTLPSDKANDTKKMDTHTSIIQNQNPVVVLKNLNGHDMNQLTHSNSTPSLSPQLSANEPVKKLKKPLKRLLQRPAEKSPILLLSSESANTVQPNKLANTNRLPIYKQIVTSKMSVPNSDDNSVYDYFANSQNSSAAENCNDDPMREVYKKLQREKKIVLSRKPKKNQTKSKKTTKQPKPLWDNEKKRLNFKKNLIDLKTFIQKDLLAKPAKPLGKPVVTTNDDVMSEEDDGTSLYSDCDEHNDFQCDYEQAANADKPNPISTSSKSISDDPLEFIDIIKNVKKTYPSKSLQKCGGNPKSKANDLYQLALKKPTHQSTPVHTWSGVSNVASPSPWRAEPDQIQHLLNSGRARVELPVYTKSLIRFREPPEDTPTTSQLSIRTDSRKEQTFGSVIGAAKRLRYSQFEMDRNVSTRTSAESSNLDESVNLSNIENIEPINHQQIQSTLKETITLTGARKTLPRSPLKSLAIRNIRLPLQDNMPLKHVDLEVSFISYKSLLDYCSTERYRKLMI